MRGMLTSSRTRSGSSLKKRSAQPRGRPRSARGHPPIATNTNLERVTHFRVVVDHQYLHDDYASSRCATRMVFMDGVSSKHPPVFISVLVLWNVGHAPGVVCVPTRW